MAFDLYLGEERAFIEHHEEGLFSLITELDQYPKLNWLWESFYDGPLIQPEVANQLVHELIALRKTIECEAKSKNIVNTIDRILPFLSKAFSENKQIKCLSD